MAIEKKSVTGKHSTSSTTKSSAKKAGPVAKTGKHETESRTKMEKDGMQTTRAIPSLN